MNITEKLEYSKKFLEVNNELCNYKCKDIAVLQNHVVYKLIDKNNEIKFSKFTIAEIVNLVPSLEDHVYCTNCFYGKELINSVDGDTKTPACCEDCYPYDFEDSTPLEDRPNYKPLIWL